MDVVEERTPDDIARWAAEHGIELVPVGEKFDPVEETELETLRALVRRLSRPVQRQRPQPKQPVDPARISIATKRALANLRARGIVWGTVPLGYMQQGNQIVPDPDEQLSLAIAYRARQNGASWRAIADALNEVRPRTNGRRWHARAIHRVLTNAT